MSRTTNTMTRLMRAAGFTVMLAGGTACTKIDKFHGYAPSNEELSEVVIGQTTKADVVNRFGPPVSEGALTTNAVYYAYSQFVHYGAFAPEEVDRQVVAIRFDANDRATNVARYTLQDGKVVALDRRVTDDGINDVSVIGQLLGALGRVDAGTFLGAEE
ncbi:outer membrane protein assembly factor BamE [Loktanella sp. S4079]|uniref:outer membrane protein assembly factor BamE n=1 Tax=Loktanella sp. S4079 TaxID=579483 RepID=UPI000696FB4B|nr:outer membrane protein assembly factor BamE [Loktanella sp. S4079]